MSTQIDAATESFAKSVLRDGADLKRRFLAARTDAERTAVRLEWRKLRGDEVSRAVLAYELDRRENAQQRARAGKVRR